MEHHPQLKKKLNSRKQFLKDLAFDLCAPSIRTRSENPLTTRFYFIRTAMESVLGAKIAPPIVPATVPASVVQKDASGRTKVEGNCKACWEADKKKRKTRKRCYRCIKPVCDQHAAAAPTVCLECSVGAQ